MTTFILNRTIDEEFLSIKLEKKLERFDIKVGRLNDTAELNTSSGLNVSIKKITDSEGLLVYKILPYNIYVAIFRGTDGALLRIIERKPIGSLQDDLLFFDGYDPLSLFQANVSLHLLDNIKRKLDKLIEDLPKRPIRSAGRNLVGLREVGEGLGLPPNVEGHIGSFLSGKKGSAASQTNKLRQNLGESLAPRPGGGGKRTRRRRRRQ